MSEANTQKRMRCESTDGPFCDEMAKNLQSSMSVRSDTAVGLLGFGSHKPDAGFYDRVSLRGRPGGDLYLIPYCPFCGARIDGGDALKADGYALWAEDMKRTLDDLTAKLGALRSERSTARLYVTDLRTAASWLPPGENTAMVAARLREFASMLDAASPQVTP